MYEYFEYADNQRITIEYDNTEYQITDKEIIQSFDDELYKLYGKTVYSNVPNDNNDFYKITITYKYDLRDTTYTFYLKDNNIYFTHIEYRWNDVEKRSYSEQKDKVLIIDKEINLETLQSLIEQNTQ